MNYDETLEISFHFFGQNMFGVSKARLRYEKAILYLEFFLLTSYAKKKKLDLWFFHNQLPFSSQNETWSWEKNPWNHSGRLAVCFLKYLNSLRRKRTATKVTTKSIGMKFWKNIWKSHFEVLKLGLQQHTVYQGLSMKSGKSIEKH